MAKLFKFKKKSKKIKEKEKDINEKEIIEIGEKVKFWKEQDRLNKELVPRVLKNHKLIEELLSKELSLSKRLDNMDDVLKKYELNQSKTIGELKESKNKKNENKFLSEFNETQKNHLVIFTSITAIIISIISLLINVI